MVQEVLMRLSVRVWGSLGIVLFSTVLYYFSTIWILNLDLEMLGFDLKFYAFNILALIIKFYFPVLGNVWN